MAGQETPPESDASTAAGKASCRPSRRGWVYAGPAVGLMVGLFAGLADSGVLAQNVRDLITPRLLLENASFTLITYSTCGVVVCTAACVVGALAGRFRQRLRSRLEPRPLALAGFLALVPVLLVWIALRRSGLTPPRGLAAVAGSSVVWVIALVPLAWVCLRLGRTVIGRCLAPAPRIAVWPALVLLIASIGVQWQGRSRIQSPDGFWPIANAESSERPNDRPPDVVFIVMDTLRVDRLGCYGYPRPTSPHLDAFADDAVLFRWAISQSPWTVPSHACMFTGLYLSQYGLRSGWLDDRFVTLAEALRDRGYQTMALSNNRIVAPCVNLTQGFEQFAEPVGVLYPKCSLAYGLMRYALYGDRSFGPLLGKWLAYDAGGRTTAPIAARWLGARDRSRPFLLFCNYMETHGPYEPPSTYRRQFVQGADLDRSYRIDQSRSAGWLFSLAGEPIYSPRDLKILSDLYDARVRELDDYFADLMRVLAAEVDLDQTLVIVVSDHGENLGDHGMLGHQFSVHNTLLHVPLLIRWPRALRPTRVTRVVQTFDLFPTILDWTGARADPSTEILARSLATALQPTTQSVQRCAFSEYLHYPESQLRAVQQLVPGFDPSRWEATYQTVFDGQWKLIMRSSKHLELYDLLADPGETFDQGASQPKTTVRLLTQLKQWQQSYERYDPSQSSTPLDPRLDEERRQRLHELGYVQ